MVFSKLFSKKSGSVAVDQQKVQEFVSRGLENAFPSKESLVKALSTGKRLTVYLGIDPTGPTLHMGHAIPLMKLSQLQEMGHKVILLMGDFTAMIGDPTDKAATRKRLTRDEVMANLREYKKQAATFLSFSGPNAAEVRYNSDWLGKMTFADVVELASNMTVQQMIERDMFDKRIKEGKPVHIHEFLYPLMQGYDSVAMDVDMEVGGNDQTFNMLAGRDLLRTLKGKEKTVVATRLLVDPSGKKMGKTEGNMITLADSASEKFGKVMSWTDGMILGAYELCTRVSMAEIEKERAFLANGGNPRDAKVRLATAVVELYHGADAAAKAKDGFFATFAKASGAAAVPADAPSVTVEKGAALADILVANKIVASKTEWRRLVGEKAVTDIGADAKIDAFDAKVEKDVDVRVGKHRFIRIRVK